MNDEIIDGGPAFPLPGILDLKLPDDTPPDFGTGLTIRDWFAGQALNGILKTSTEEYINNLAAGVRGGKFHAAAAYQLADAMLEARRK